MIPIYVINLKRSADRRAWMTSELSRAGVTAEFLAAADGRRFQARCKTKAGFLTKEEVALTISHRRAWRKLLSSAAAYAVVLEDDVHFGADFRPFLTSDFSRFAFDVIKLEKWASRAWISRKGQPVCGRKLHRLGYEHFGTAAYLVSRAGAAKLLAATKPIAAPVDVAMFGGPVLLRGGLSVLQLVPAIAIQDDFLPEAAAKQRLGSTLHADRSLRKAEQVRRKPRGLPRVRREAARVLGQIGRWLRLAPTMRRAAMTWE